MCVVFRIGYKYEYGVEFYYEYVLYSRDPFSYTKVVLWVVNSGASYIVDVVFT